VIWFIYKVIIGVEWMCDLSFRNENLGEILGIGKFLAQILGIGNFLDQFVGVRYGLINTPSQYMIMICDNDWELGILIRIGD
jgi:hypothetical protein